MKAFAFRVRTCTFRESSERLYPVKVPSLLPSCVRGTQLPLFARLSTLTMGSLHGQKQILGVKMEFPDVKYMIHQIQQIAFEAGPVNLRTLVCDNREMQG